MTRGAVFAPPRSPPTAYLPMEVLARSCGRRDIRPPTLSLGHPPHLRPRIRGVLVIGAGKRIARLGRKRERSNRASAGRPLRWRPMAFPSLQSQTSRPRAPMRRPRGVTEGPAPPRPPLPAGPRPPDRGSGKTSECKIGHDHVARSGFRDVQPRASSPSSSRPVAGASASPAPPARLLSTAFRVLCVRLCARYSRRTGVSGVVEGRRRRSIDGFVQPAGSRMTRRERCVTATE